MLTETDLRLIKKIVLSEAFTDEERKRMLDALFFKEMNLPSNDWSKGTNPEYWRDVYDTSTPVTYFYTTTDMFK